MLQIVADENIPHLAEAFGEFGEVYSCPGRQITASTVEDADVLLVRSVTRVGADLLRASPVRFVGTATAGIDHVDTQWLLDRGIEFASAAGSNAESVAQYVAAALIEFRSRLGRPLRGSTIGIVGVGHCGSRVERIARALGMEPLLCDPPLARAPGSSARFNALDELRECDYLTLHVPLTMSGADRTEGLIDSEFLASMNPRAVVINAARGGVLDEDALVGALSAGKLSGAAIDAWIGEPSISLDTLRAATIATPHIAGYSIDGKLRGTQLIHEALARFLGREPAWSAFEVLPPVAVEIRLDAKPCDRASVLAGAIQGAYPIARDDAKLREIENLARGERASKFDRLRREYPQRREFHATRLTISESDEALRRAAAGLGFSVVKIRE